MALEQAQVLGELSSGPDMRTLNGSFIGSSFLCSERTSSTQAGLCRRRRRPARLPTGVCQPSLVGIIRRSAFHARYYWLLLAESHLTRRLFGSMLQRIWALPPAGRLTGGVCHGVRPGEERDAGREKCPRNVVGGARPDGCRPAQRSSPRRDRGDRECRPERGFVGVSCG